VLSFNDIREEAADFLDRYHSEGTRTSWRSTPLLFLKA
jgi:hypothetical protein